LWPIRFRCGAFLFRCTRGKAAHFPRLCYKLVS
jgi:hypothetical protein